VRGSEDASSIRRHESGLSCFIAPARRRRFRELLTAPRGRERLRRELAHYEGLDPRYTTKLIGESRKRAQIHDHLLRLGAPERCYVLSEDPRLDGRLLTLNHVLQVTVGQSFGTLVSCIPGVLGYFENEDGRWMLQRPHALNK
jgi:hypothetical protein